MVLCTILLPCNGFTDRGGGFFFPPLHRAFWSLPLSFTSLHHDTTHVPFMAYHCARMNRENKSFKRLQSGPPNHPGLSFDVRWTIIRWSSSPFTLTNIPSPKGGEWTGKKKRNGETEKKKITKKKIKQRKKEQKVEEIKQERKRKEKKAMRRPFFSALVCLRVVFGYASRRRVPSL